MAVRSPLVKVFPIPLPDGKEDGLQISFLVIGVLIIPGQRRGHGPAQVDPCIFEAMTDGAGIGQHGHVPVWVVVISNYCIIRQGLGFQPLTES